MALKRSNHRKTTIVDIARACGVSVTTVSRILNNRPDVAEETRQRVLRAIAESGFTPHTAWQQLRSGKSRTIALHFPQDFNPPSHSIITSAALGCEEAGFSLQLVANALSESELLAIYRSGQADGMILMEILTHDWRAELLRQNGLPFVMIGRCADNTGLSYVDLDIGRGVYESIQYLAALGHRHIGFITLAPVRQEKEYGYATWALKGYEQAREQFDLPDHWQAVDQQNEDTAQVVLDLLAAHPEITAIVTPQETGVPAILKAIQSTGLRIPEEISIIGLLTESISELITPPLTTISFPAQDMGREAARILISQLEDSPAAAPSQLLLHPELALRGSTGPARRR